eukprot:CAMPEP_0181298132 /NCGR_PEP_ID=MMETSP1101-20121128/5619_1 /TAXON_ID=46948 /ORGANISM="Rhodomonas abbreviata, Strain Caron Lab Isolate" /LENGTH=319 /DNA_ID=CAMNT_0023403133 /DNA_START=485 /DNA_END=1444 /DNA_ORIENTATION=-
MGCLLRIGEQFGKIYEGAEHIEKFAVFKANLEIIEAHNKLYEAGEETFHMAANMFADMTNEQYSKTMLGYRPDLKPLESGPGGHGKACKHRDSTNVTKHIDWRTMNAVTNVKNQGQCGSCWSFSTTGSVEGAWAVAGHPLVSLSEEELVQCDTRSDEGCNGGLMDNAYQWIIQNGGIASEEVYPYISGNGTRGMCHMVTLKTKVASIEDWCDLNVGDEKDLELALMQQPVAVAIEADQTSFQFYSGGVLPSKKCGTKLDHGVLAVGFGYSKKHKMHYWIVKNSWGSQWGDEGYIMLQKMSPHTHHSCCGIANAASYPVV